MNAGSITTPALAARVRRRLARDRQLLRRCWPWDTRYAERGDYYIAEAHTHRVVAQHVNVEQLARALGVLPENVVVEDDYPHTDGEVPAVWMEPEEVRSGADVNAAPRK